MTSPYERWVRAAVWPAQRLEPSETEVARVLAESISRGSSNRYRRRFFWTWRSATLAIIASLLVAGTAAAITMLILKEDDGRTERRTTETTLDQKGTPPAESSPNRAEPSIRSKAEKDAGKATIASAYEELDVVARDWYVRIDANVAAGMFAAKKDERLARFCEFMSSDAKRETVAYARSTADLRGFKWTCPSAVALLIRRSNQRGTARRMLRAKVIGVNLQGNRGTATLDFGSGPQSTVPLIKEDGEWKLAAAPGADN
jgi:hypothetical protein